MGGSQKRGVSLSLSGLGVGDIHDTHAKHEQFDSTKSAGSPLNNYYKSGAGPSAVVPGRSSFGSVGVDAMTRLKAVMARSSHHL